MLPYDRTLILGQDENSIEVSTRISRRAKKISVSVSPQKGVVLVIPKNARKDKALEFLYSKQEWILSKTREVLKNAKTPMVEGARIPICGEHYTITHSGSMRGVTHLKDHCVIVSGPKEFIARKVTTFLKELAKKEITARAEIEAMKLGVKYASITTRDTSTRWGSCSASGALSFSWRLILAPREVLEYVVAHEIAHRLEMNHGKKFWAIVEDIYPQHHAARKWLKENGTMLHGVGA